MAAFIRRYETEPTEAELLKIEGVVVIDGKPVAQVRGIGTGTVMCTGETEDGPFAADGGPVEVFGDADYGARFGGFGFTYAGITGQHPCCRSRNADGAVTDEFWNGSAFVQLRSGRFSRLFIARVDTSVGAVEFNRLASLAGNTSPSWDLEPGWTLVLSIDGAGNVTVTWDAAAAVIVSGAGTYPWAPVGGETIVFKVDGTQYTATFLNTDTTQALVIARLNAAAGSTRFANTGPGIDDTTFTGIIRGTGGSVQIVSGSAAALAATGFVAGAAVPGTGDVANIDLVSDAEVRTRILADAPGASSDRDSSGRLRVFSTTDDGTGTIEVDTTSTTNAAFGFTVETEATAAAGVAGTIPAGTRVSASGSGQLFVIMQTVNVTAANPGPYSVKVRHATDDQTGTGEIAAAVNTVFEPIQLGAFSVSNPLPVTVALTDAQIESIVVGKPKSARAPKKGFSVSIGRFNENVFLYCDDCATLADAPIQKSEQYGSYSIAMGLTNTTAIKNLTKISAYLASKSCANGKMGVLLETEDDLTKQFVGLADASGHVQLALRDLEDATKRAFTILDADGLALDPDNTVIGNRPVRRLVFQIAFISFTAKDANITTYKPLVYLELGAQTAAPAADGARTTAAAPIAWGRR